MNRRAFLQTAGFGTGVAFTAARRAFAQSYPSRAVRVVVPASASTPPDILARIIANNLSEREGWKMIVENKPGAVMTIGISDVLKQESVASPSPKESDTCTESHSGTAPQSRAGSGGG
jgi:tripartite-type tricarboxylate transporter receptor subunit TctC